jgi:hypothetical protein
VLTSEFWHSKSRAKSLDDTGVIAQTKTIKRRSDDQMLLIVNSLLSDIGQNLPFLIVFLVVGMIPYKVHVCKRAGKRKGWNIELDAYLWQFACNEQGWSLHMTGVRLMNRKMRDKLNK